MRNRLVGHYRAAAVAAVICAVVTLGSACAEPQRTRRAAAVQPAARTATSEPSATATADAPLASAFRVRSADGREFDSRALAGKPVVLVFFASWCGVCGRELPEVQSAVQHAGDGVVALGVSLDDDDTWSDVDSFVKKKGIAFPIVRGQSYADFVETYDPTYSFPTVVVLDTKGRVAASQRGARGREALVSAIERARAATP